MAGASGRRFRSLSFLFGFAGRTPRGVYVLTGILLAAVKALVDALLIWRASGTVWNPLAYLDPRFSIAAWFPVHGGAFTFALWTLPFLWIGLALSVRRARDAGLPPWVPLLFVAPLLNYALIVVLAIVPSSTREDSRDRPTLTRGQVPTAVFAVVVATAVGASMIVLAVSVFERYGFQLFVALPVVYGAVIGFLVNHRAAVGFRFTAGAIAVGLLTLCVVLVLVAIEGVLCVLAVAPLAVPLALIGGVLGRETALRTRARPSSLAAVIVGWVAATAIEAHLAPPPQMLEVRSEIDVEAPPSRVWETLVSFADITDEPAWYFRRGIACPTSARIEGVGVGAVRRCEFTTGAFVEPITAWDAPTRLAFDVAAQPPPLVEWSPWDVHPPHLDGYLRSRRGEFRLADLGGGRTRLSGSTWYELDIHPVAYWSLWSDGIISAIHRRVLVHLKRAAERS